jgi:hypothetical protein
MATPRLLTDGRVLVVGGSTVPDAAVSYSDLFSPKTNSWISVPNMRSSRCGQAAVLLPIGQCDGHRRRLRLEQPDIQR